jgi:hypothetical protein
MFEDLRLIASIMARAPKWKPVGSHGEIIEAVSIMRRSGEYGIARYYLAQARAIRLRELGRVN